MAKETRWKCDLCGEYCSEQALRRLDVRTSSDRPDGGSSVDVGPCCYMAPIAEVLRKAAEFDEATPEDSRFFPAALRLRAEPVK